MSSSPAQLASTQVSAPAPRRWTSLAFVSLAQLMVALDATIVNIALPSAQAALHASDADRQWVITAYTLSFGGLLLLGGRLADFFGRKRSFMVGLTGFALASMLGGAAPNLVVLVGARALQGAFGALLAPTALALLATTFTEPKERAKAFAVYGAIAGSGAAAGMLLGGVLTQYLTWRWCLYVNIPIAVVAGIGGWFVLKDSRSAAKPRFDLLGVVLAASGLVALVFACTLAVSQGLRSIEVVSLLGASVALLALFVAWEAHTANPLLPLHIVLDRNRGGAYLTVALGIAGMFGAFLFLTYYLQVVLRFTPIQAGLAFLPMTLASQAGSWLIAARLMPRLPARALMAPGALVAAAGMALLTLLQPDSNYWTVVLPAELLLGLGTSCVMVPAFSIGTLGVDRREAGIAAATVNTFQQIGGSLGVAVLNTIAASATAAYLAVNQPSGVEAIVHGYSVATGWGVAILVLGALVAAILINAGKPGSGAREADVRDRG
jgi:EmrB/QacA subfamily drug resistance transporter